ncbi:MAG: hypothetical protein SOT80_02025 [Candidatus Pseudoruminococcus sp.]|uniref:hypothetical protein n=1 Tax=Candidatus Pseudoruminococcus sp. TaxID=3101048 RepID=UPI002A7BB6DA|nr:hypothetical protein [Ruminococcus sp.]MDY2782163.1 hypothetical protein [Candidatus Pseudoruminococcus sp.]
MKKMTVVILTAALAAAIMAGCSGGSDNSSSNTSTNSATNSTVSSSESQADKDESKNTSKSESKNSEESKENSKESSKTESAESKNENSKEDKKSEAIDAVIYNNVEIKIGMDASPILEKLGKPDHSETIKSNEDNSEGSYSYTYDNMTIYIYFKDKKQYVTDVSIDGPGDASTANGVKIGATKDSIEKIYGKVTDDKMTSYEIGKNIIIFVFEDDFVTNISLSKGIDEEL